MSKLSIKAPAPIGLADIAEQAAHSVEMMSQIRSAMLSPTTRKGSAHLESEPACTTAWHREGLG